MAELEELRRKRELAARMKKEEEDLKNERLAK